jgi:retron-type reverse transcriptase
MKIACVFPIYKSKSSHEVNNYRPISLLTSISKLLEKIIHKRIFNFLENNELFNDLQFGFRPKRSTVDTIALFLGNLLQSIEDGNYNMGIFIDLSKAFDTINHNILLDKLYRLGIRGQQITFSKAT